MRAITEAELEHIFRSVRHSAFRLELQPAYNEPVERASVEAFLAGHPEPPDTNMEGFRGWYDRTQALTASGITITRVRVHQDPPTDYQRWLRWFGQWATRAGEQHIYLTPEQATQAGLNNGRDFWLFDDTHLIFLAFDDQGRRTNQLSTDPDDLAQARATRDLAVRLTRGDIHVQ
ncbi:DUF6879 family protein [Catenuloplanes japonicus]|uniref:DUF6879 family protein n=1 Tax=Catenuloplanes japonicus TaxID=33876 RepID=UPI00068D025A|nr:DUF6879 family protein [Catenuloplanes japonicus]